MIKDKAKAYIKIISKGNVWWYGYQGQGRWCLLWSLKSKYGLYIMNVLNFLIIVVEFWLFFAWIWMYSVAMHRSATDRRFFWIFYQMIAMFVDDCLESYILCYETRMQDWILLSGMILRGKKIMWIDVVQLRTRYNKLVHIIWCYVDWTVTWCLVEMEVDWIYMASHPSSLSRIKLMVSNIYQIRVCLATPKQTGDQK